MATKRSCVLHAYVHVVQLGLRIVFTAVWAQPPTVFERCVARRVRFERLSLPLGSNFLITAPPEHSLVRVLQRDRERIIVTTESINRGRVSNESVCRHHRLSFKTAREMENRTTLIYISPLYACFQKTRILVFFSCYD